MLTKLIQNFLNKNIGKLEDKNISITLPNGKRIELGNHQSSIEITFNSGLGFGLYSDAELWDSQKAISIITGKLKI